MPLKATGPGPRFEEIDRWDSGVGWIAHPDEGMQRAGHAIVEDGDVWLVDPLDAEGLDEMLADLGDVTGVVLLLDRHERDAGTLARRHDVPVYLPAGVDRDVDAPTRRFAGVLPGTRYRVVPVVDWPGWYEVALFDGETLVVADVFGTSPYYAVGDEQLGFNPVLRTFPPKGLRELAPDRLVCGHGEGLPTGAAAAIDRAYGTARRNLPRALWKGLRSAL